MRITAQTLAQITGTSENENMRATITGLQRGGVGAGLERPHRLAMYLGQLGHESAGWKYDREIWGPTPAQLRYEGRKDLGNIVKGDGSRFRGRGPIQITGRANYAEFTNWARLMDKNAPNFLENPDAVNTDPWEGLGPIWFWQTRGINAIADRGDFEGVTRRINGGTNGLEDRRRYYARAALVLMGRKPSGIREYQMAVGLSPDGVPGPKTVASLHKALSTMPVVSFGALDATPYSPRPVAPASPNGKIAAAVIAAIVAVAAFMGFR